jgi:hypothetical protein
MGFICTDKSFFGGLLKVLEFYGLNISGVTYSEQGMHGSNHASLDVGQDFVDS